VVHAIPEERVSEFMPEVAGIDSAVSIEIQGETATYVVVADSDPRYWPDEIAASSSTAAAIVGKRVDETVVLSPTPLGPRTGTVRAIQHKYVARFQGVLGEFNRRFPEATGLWKFKSEEVLANLTSLLDARAERIRKAMEAYEHRQVTVGLLGKMVERSGFETWRTLLGNPAFRPFVRTGKQEALGEAIERLRASDAVVLDLTAAVTLFGLDLLEHARQYHRRVCVPQAVIDGVSKEIDEHRMISAGRPMLVTFKQGETYYREEVTAEQVRELIEGLERMRDQLRQCSSIPRPVRSRIYSNADVAAALGEEFADAIAIAEDSGAVLVSDDLFLRELAANEWGIKGIASFDLLAYAVTIGKASTEEFENATLRMVRWKCRGIPVRASTILRALQRSSLEIDDDVTAVLEVLADEEIESGSAVRVVVGVLRELWLGPVLPHRLRQITDAMLNALTRHRGPMVLEQLKSGIAAAMRLVPQYGRVLNKVIDDFGRHRYRGEIIP
jgi:hypothetical protein